MENPSSSRHFSATIFLVTIFILISSSGLVTSDINQDKKECSAQLSEFTACLPFVGGKEKSPTATCCTNLKKEINKTRKCLCLIVKDRNDPGLGFVLNATLALSLPTVCHTPGNASDCPALLKLPPNSTDAQIFQQFGGSNSSGITVTGTPTPTSSSEAGKGRKWLEMGMLFGVSLWLHFSL
ncbi:protein YLS3-like [Melia azedarach]|uniref:Protein YLS3-like n=1 Tax=Melia azedarach TaxID=155640 RepID=A0ACC1X230_MELAZ|nr:protein YLS3-like [Melia azedarach]